MVAKLAGSSRKVDTHKSRSTATGVEAIHEAIHVGHVDRGLNQSIEDIPAAQCARSAHGEEQSSGQPDDGSPNFDELLGGTLPHESYSDGDAVFSEVARSQLALADVAVLASGGSLVDEG